MHVLTAFVRAAHVLTAVVRAACVSSPRASEPVSQSYVNHISASAVCLRRARSSILNVSTIAQRQEVQLQRISAENPGSAKFYETPSDARGEEAHATQADRDGTPN